MSVVPVVTHSAAIEVFGEGPHWEPSTKSLLYVDAAHNKAVHRWDSITGINHILHLNAISSPSLIIPRESGGYVVTIDKQLMHLDWSTGSLTPLEDLSGVKGEESNSFNDGKCDSRGRLWVGTLPTYTEDDLTVPPEQGSLYSIEGGVVRKHVDKINLSNGLAWSSDDQTLFYVDSVPRQIFAFDFNLETGNLSNRRVAVTYPKGSEETLGYPDGMTIDTNGNLWVACVMGRKVACFDPRTDQLLRTVDFPVKAITSCCFGGENMDELYVTSARRDSYGEDKNGRAPLPGALFKVTGLGVKGQPANVYRG